MKIVDYNVLDDIRTKRESRMDEGWVTVNGTHIMVDENGDIAFGPQGLKDWNNSKKAASTGNYKDLKEAKEYFKNNYGINLGVEQLNFDAVKPGLAGIENAIKQYPFLKDTIGYIGAKNAGVMCCTGSGIYFNPKYFKGSTEQLDSLIESQIKSGFWPENSTLESVAFHETAHAIDYALCVKENGHGFYAMKDFGSGEQVKDIISQACKDIKKTDYGKGMKNADLFKGISGYAGKGDKSEVFAEAFADKYANGDKANPLSLRICELAEQKMSKTGLK